MSKDALVTQYKWPVRRLVRVSEATSHPMVTLRIGVNLDAGRFLQPRLVMWPHRQLRTAE